MSLDKRKAKIKLNLQNILDGIPIADIGAAKPKTPTKQISPLTQAETKPKLKKQFNLKWILSDKPINDIASSIKSSLPTGKFKLIHVPLTRDEMEPAPVKLEPFKFEAAPLAKVSPESEEQNVCGVHKFEEITSEEIIAAQVQLEKEKIKIFDQQESNSEPIPEIVFALTPEVRPETQEIKETQPKGVTIEIELPKIEDVEIPKVEIEQTKIEVQGPQVEQPKVEIEMKESKIPKEEIEMKELESLKEIELQEFKASPEKKSIIKAKTPPIIIPYYPSDSNSLDSSSSSHLRIPSDVVMPYSPVKFEENKKLKQLGIHLSYPIGHGSCGIVYSGTWRNKKIECACKVITEKKNFKMEDRIKMIKNQIEILNVIHENRHPYLIHCHILFNLIKNTYSLTLYELMEICSGNLYDFITDNHGFSEKVNNAYQINAMYEHQLKVLFKQFIKGLMYLHSEPKRFKGASNSNICICHCNLKPENLLYKLTSKGHPIYKISDFESALLFTNDEPRLCHQRRGSYLLNGLEIFNEPYDAEMCDIYAFGAIILNAAIGFFEPPMNHSFHCKEAIATLQKGKIEFCLRFKCGRLLTDLLAGLLKVDPSERMSLENALKHKWVQKAV